MRINRYFSINMILLLLTLINLSNELKSSSLTSPYSLNLLDNSNAVVTLDGIHFYDSTFENEEEGKKIPLTIEETEYEKIFIAQFPSEYDGYIIIFVQNIIYIFDSNKNKKKSQNMTESINSSHYCIIPYKKINDNLNFFITYRIETTLYIANCNFDLSNQISDIEIEIISLVMKGIDGNTVQKLEGMDCLLMSPLSTLSINNDLLTCFGSIEWPPYVFSMTFNPDENFQEISELKDYKAHTSFPYIPYRISAAINKKKKKALVYIIVGEKPFWATYDYNNKFSDIYAEGISYYSLQSKYWNHKVLFFTQTSEFVAISTMGICDIFIIVFNINYNIYYKGYLEHEASSCDNMNSFGIYYNSNNYTILYDNGIIFLIIGCLFLGIQMMV